MRKKDQVQELDRMSNQVSAFQRTVWKDTRATVELKEKVHTLQKEYKLLSGDCQYWKSQLKEFQVTMRMLQREIADVDLEADHRICKKIKNLKDQKSLRGHV